MSELFGIFVVETKRHLIANNPSFNATFDYSVSTVVILHNCMIMLCCW